MIAQILLYLLIAIYFLSLWKIFEKAGEEKWKGFVPVLNILVALKIMKKPWWWVFLFIIPGINLLMLVILNVELGKSYGQRNFTDNLFALLLPWIFIPRLAFDKNIVYTGPIDWEGKKKGAIREWGDAILFAVIAATIIRTFTLEAFTIPTGSMEKSLRVGDYLFVSKMAYGPRMPMTPISFPFAHHTMPGTDKMQSYVEWFSQPYFRLPGFGSVERLDAVVFNFPAGDTIINDPELQGHNYYSIIQGNAYEIWRKNGEKDDFWSNKEKYEAAARSFFEKRYGIKARPLDKRENYIKRCVGMPGDTYEIKEGIVYANGEKIEFPEKAQMEYLVKTNGQLNPMILKEQYDINPTDISFDGESQSYLIAMPVETIDKIKSLSVVESVTLKLKEKGSYDGTSMPIFPNDPNYNWTEDNFGPLYIPKEGDVIDLTLENLPLYRRAIEVYEKNSLEVKGDQIIINGEVATSYSFKQNYYMMMGDNRHHSADSRFWGFVPEDHVVGEAVFVWFSKDPYTGIRWNRVFSLVH
jgi:signal peptidase I